MNKNSSKSKTATSKTKKNPSVSKYFHSKKDEPNQKSTPNKSDPKIKFNDSADDFRSPMPIPKKINLTWKLKEPKRKTNKKSKSKSKNCTLAIIKDNFEGGDENPEHLQMAIALSKSTYEAEYGHNSELENVPDIKEILQNVKPTNLERFGFKKSKPTMAVEYRTLQKPEVSRKGKGRLKYITRILDIRSPQERESIIESKIRFVLNQPNIATKKPSASNISLTSLILQEFKSENCTVFGLDNLYRKNCFYVEDLLLEKNQNKCCGFLLKDWSLIPGRDKSPTKTPLNNTEKSGRSPLKTDLCKESLLEHKVLQNDLGMKVSDEKLSRSQKQSPMNPITTKLLPNENREDAKDSLRSPLINPCESSIKTDTMKLRTLHVKDSGVSSLGPYCSSPVSINRSISPDLFSSDEEYDRPALNVNQATSPVGNKNIDEKKQNLESLDSRLDNDIPRNHSNFSLKPSSFYSLDEFEDHIDEGNLSSGFREHNSDEDCVLSPKFIAKTTEIVKMGSIENFTCLYDVEKKTTWPETVTDLNLAKNISESIVPISSEFDSPKSTASNCRNEILRNSFQNIDKTDTESTADNLPNSIDVGPSSFQRNIEGVQISPSVNSFEEYKEHPTSHQSCIDSTSNQSGNVVDNDKYLVESELKKNTLTLEELLEKIPTDLDVDCPLLDHNHDEMVEAADMSINDETNTALDLSQQKHNSCIEILDDPSSDLVYESKPSESPIFDDYKFDPNIVHETPKKSPSTNNSTPVTTTSLSSIRTSNAFNSADLNVTDYVNQILNKERFSFDNYNIEISEEITSQDSQSDFVDEELNYSCHFATPVKPSREVIFEEEDMPKSVSPDAPLSIIESISTPNKYIIKTDNITPMPNYDKMATPLVNKELQKMGIKPLKRAKGSKLLKYIYESTHPLVGSVDLMEASDSDSEGKIIKRRKRRQEEPRISSVEKETVLNDACNNSSIEIVGNLLIQNEKPENLIFERKQSAKIPSCRVPLQIVWHNFLSCNPTIQENVLLYEPLHLESLHELLKEQGFKFHVQDLSTFLDRKCITIRTNQNRGKKRR